MIFLVDRFGWLEIRTVRLETFKFRTAQSVSAVHYVFGPRIVWKGLTYAFFVMLTFTRVDFYRYLVFLSWRPSFSVYKLCRNLIANTGEILKRMYIVSRIFPVHIASRVSSCSAGSLKWDTLKPISGIRRCHLKSNKYNTLK